MEKLIFCRICLCKDLQMEELINPELFELYQKLSGGPFQTEDMKPSLVCFICKAMLCKAYKLMLNCMKAEILLSQIINSQKVRSLLKCPLLDLRIAKISLIAIRKEAELIDVEIKEEGETLTKSPALQEDSKTGISLGDLEINNALDTYDNGITSDSEDDLPLTSIKEEQRRDRIHEENTSVNLNGKNLKNKNSFNDKKRKLKKAIDKKNNVKDIEKKINGTPTYVKVKLSKEQQVEMLRERSRSNNYLHSPYKCDLCYKGYRDEKTYENHRQKHDERAGTHVCQICGLRYSSAKRLHTHSMVAHVTLYRCQNCDHVSHTANQARVHERWHSGFKYDCRLCGREFKKPTTYLTHLRKSHPTEHVCNICGDSFAGQQGLKVHRTKSHSNLFKTENQDVPVAERFCSDCNIQFMSKEAWQRHMVTSYKHSTKNESDWVCALCGWSGRGEERVRHMNRHVRDLNGRGSMPSKVITHCQQCTSSFSSRHILEAHVKRVHLGIKYNKNVVCEICGKKCTSNASLRYHQRVHTGEKPYPCGTCDKRFADSNQLRIHTRTHTGERPYGCTACGKRFSQKPALNRHYRVHTGARPYTCELCSRSFTQSSSLKMHLRCVHSKQPSEKRRRQKLTEELKTAIDPDVS